MKELGQDWYDASQVNNLFGLSYMKEKHRIKYDSDKEDALISHKN